MQQFDPVLIVYQIVSLQCFYYLAFGTLLGICHALFDIKVSLDHFFTSNYIDLTTSFGWIQVGCVLSASLAG
ncbi:hypothetical protein EON65_01925 [archaeon]|nr:MAG: hypothetical protein EON65_01925 [archaeon]